MTLLAGSRLSTQMVVIGSSAILLCTGILTIPFFHNGFEPIPWLTLIVGGVFGLAITIISSRKAQKVLDFINNSEKERQTITKRIILNNILEIQQSAQYFFDTIKDKDLTSQDKRGLFGTFLPKFKTLISSSQISTPSLGNSISSTDIEKIEKYLKLFNDLFLILEYGNDDQFENNISQIKDYSQKLIDKLNKIRD